MNQTTRTKEHGRAKRAFSYIRFSRPEQIRGDSLRRQYEATREYCDRNGLVLDEDLNLQDMGVSAFRGQNAVEGALGAFIAAVESGKIPEGSTLIVESLDRLSRDVLGRAQSLILSILSHGITLVTLTPEKEYPPGSANDLGAAIEIIVTLYRAHEESATKSQRVGSAWANKRKNIDQKKLTARCPAWLSLSEDKTEFHVIPEAAEAVRRIFQMAVDGYGIDAITRKFNGEGFPPIGRATTWHCSYVLKILKNRSVLGEFQPHKGTPGNRQPVGDPIDDYYPAVVEEELFYRAQNALAARRGKGGRRGVEVSNLFTGLVYNAADGSSIVLVNKGSPPKGGKRLTSSASVRGEKGAQRLSICYEPFEQQLLTWLGGLTGEVFSTDSDKGSVRRELESVEGMHADVSDRIRKIQARLIDGSSKEFDSVLPVLEQLDVNVRELESRREELRAQFHGGQDHTLQTYRTAWQRLREAPPDQRERLRSKLKLAISRLVDRFELSMEKEGVVIHVLVKVHADGRADPWYIYFVVRGRRSVWLSIGGGMDIDLKKLKRARYVPFSWRNIPMASETDMATPAPVVKELQSDAAAGV